MFCVCNLPCMSSLTVGSMLYTGLASADQASVAPQTVEFVHSKAAKKAKREWKAEQEDKGALPKQPKRTSPFLTIIVVLCSTLSAVLFGYRMYIKHYGPIRKQYVRLFLCAITFSNRKWILALSNPLQLYTFCSCCTLRSSWPHTMGITELLG